jgi:hypothetical protein
MQASPTRVGGTVAPRTRVPGMAASQASQTLVPGTAASQASQTLVPGTAASQASQTLVPGTAASQASQTPVPGTAASQASQTPVPGTAASQAPRMRVPDFFIVGHPKCGTTALHATLKRHPQIYMPVLKEPRYFASELRSPPPRQPTGDPETLDEYLSLFEDARPDQRAGEASPQYLWSRAAAAHIAQLQPAARIVAILREPASFLRSLHLQFVQSYNEDEQDLGRAIALEETRRQGGRIPRQSLRPQMLLYSEHVRYVEQLRRYHAAFPPEQVLVLIYDDFRADNEATVRRVLRFLDVEGTVPVAVSDANPTVGVRGRRLHELVHAASVGQGPLARVARASASAVASASGVGGSAGLSRRSALAIRDRIFFTAPRPPDERVMLELRRRFKPEVAALSEYLDRDLVRLWGYERVG